MWCNHPLMWSMVSLDIYRRVMSRLLEWISPTNNSTTRFASAYAASGQMRQLLLERAPGATAPLCVCVSELKCDVCSSQWGHSAHICNALGHYSLMSGIYLNYPSCLYAVPNWYWYPSTEWMFLLVNMRRGEKRGNIFVNWPVEFLYILCHLNSQMFPPAMRGQLSKKANLSSCVGELPCKNVICMEPIKILFCSKQALQLPSHHTSQRSQWLRYLSASCKVWLWRRVVSL